MSPAPAVLVAGLTMLACTVNGAPPLAFAAAGLGVAAVVAALRYRSSAVVAVHAAIAALALGEPSAPQAVLAGLGAAVFMLVAYTRDTPGQLATALSGLLRTAAVLAAAALLATSLPAGAHWLPVVAPVVAIALYTAAILPYVAGRLPHQ